MIQTENLQLEKYELDDAANLADGYNNSMDKIDAYAGSINAKFPITSSDIGDGEVNTVDIANGAVTESKLAADAVTSDKIASNAVGTEHIKDGSITSAKIASNSVGTDTIIDGAVTTQKIASNSVTTDKLANGAITMDVLPSEIVNDVSNNKTLVEEHVNYFTQLGVTDEQSATDLHTQIDSAYHAAMDNTQDITDLQNATVSTAKLEDGAVTRPKISDAAFDVNPTADSDNLLTSGSVFVALQNIAPPEPTDEEQYMLIFGDSYSDYSDNTGRANWMETSNIAGVSNCTLKTYAVGGMGFATGTTPVSKQIETAFAEMKEKTNKVKYCIVTCGVNDAPQVTEADFITAVNTAFNTLKTQYPNAKLLWAPTTCQSSFQNHKLINYFKTTNNIKKTSNENGYSIVPNLPYFWIGVDSSPYFDSTQVHLSLKGSKIFGQMILNSLFGTPTNTQMKISAANVFQGQPYIYATITSDYTYFISGLLSSPTNMNIYNFSNRGFADFFYIVVGAENNTNRMGPLLSNGASYGYSIWNINIPAGTLTLNCNVTSGFSSSNSYYCNIYG